MFRESPGEVALIGEAAIDSDICERRIRVQQFVLRPLDPKAEQPLVRRHPERLPERSREVAGRQAALARELGERQFPV